MTNDMTTQAETETLPALAPEPQALTVFGTSPQEMAQGQMHLVGWCDLKLASERELLADAEQNYETARKAKWRSSAWHSRMTLHQKNITYYEKIKAALEAGYWLVPPMPFNVFAYRSNRKFPVGKEWQSAWNQPSQTQALPVGDGKYVGLPDQWERKETIPTANGGSRTERYHSAQNWQQIEFPVSLVKPQIVDATQTAMARKIFDEIGILPNLPRNNDPIVVAHIKNAAKPKWHPGALFFVAWWLDFNAL